MTKCKAILLALAFAAVLVGAAVQAQGPAAPLDKKGEIGRLIQQLGSDDFEARQEASTKLAPTATPCRNSAKRQSHRTRRFANERSGSSR
jgi:Spy/CpxP family protein refolding chaperone